MFRLLALALLLSAAACERAPQADPLDAIAADYVRLTLEIGEREPGYVDAYYGPAEWAKAAKKSPRTLPELTRATQALLVRTEAAGAGGGPIEVRRRTFLLGQLRAAATRLQMLQGRRYPFVEEAEGLFGTRPPLRPLAEFDPLLKQIDSMVPGEGSLAARVAAFDARYTIPRDRLEPAMRAAIAACRMRTLQQIDLPAGERFTLEFVTGKPWSGYNWYKGNATSLIQVNTDLPVAVDRVVDLGCHEGYPGHHALNMLLESKLTKGKGWVEFSVYPLFSPQSLIAEGSANYGIELAFPGNRRRTFERETIYPLAGLDPSTANAYSDLREMRALLSGARTTIAADYLDGRIDRPTAIAQTQKYLLMSPERAAQSIDFTDTYRSYVINYGLGQDMVREYVEGAGPNREARWASMARVISEPTVPADLAR